MIKKSNSRYPKSPNYSRRYGDKFKKDIVKGIDTNRHTVKEVSDLYGVSRASIYKWIYKYSHLYCKGYRQIIEPMSSNKKLSELQKKIKELERVVGQKQLEIDFMKKVIELSEEEYRVDISKKNGLKLNSTSGRKEKK